MSSWGWKEGTKVRVGTGAVCENDFVRVFLPGNGIELGGPESKQAWLRVILRGWS